MRRPVVHRVLLTREKGSPVLKSSSFGTLKDHINIMRMIQTIVSSIPLLLGLEPLRLVLLGTFEPETVREPSS